MYIFLIALLLFNYLAAVGYSDILRLYTDRLLNIYAYGTYILIFVVFYSCPVIMEKWIIGVVIYEILGFGLYIKACLDYKRNEKDKLRKY